MRISCSISSLSGGGAERLMSGLADRLARRHDVALVTLAGAGRDDYPVAACVARYALDLQEESRGVIAALNNNHARVQRIAEAFHDFEPDVILSFGDQMNVTSLLAARRLKIPVVITEVTDPRHHRLPKIWHWLRRRYYPRAAAAVAVSAAAAAVVEKLCGFDVHVIRPAVEPPGELDLAAFKVGQRKRIAVVARISREKRFDLLIRAFTSIAEKHPDWDLEIAGSGPQADALAELIEELEMQPRIRLLGRIESVWPFFATADAYALTSLYEGTPVALLEAMAMGLACIAIDCDSGAGEILTAGEDGILTADDEHAFATALDRLLGDDALRHRLGAAAAEKAKRFTWAPCVASFERVLQAAAR